MRVACHSLVFGALPAVRAMTEVARAGFEAAVLAEIEGQARHAAELDRVPLVPVVGVDVAADAPRRVQEGIAAASWIRVTHVVVAPGGRPGGGARLSHHLHVAADVGVGIAVTPRAGSAVWDVASALRLVERHPAVRLWPDTSHLARAGDALPRAAQALAPYSAGWFVRDHDGLCPGPGSFDSQVPGRGALDLDGALAALLEAGFDGPIVFHAVGHLPNGQPRPEYSLERLRALTREARAYLSRYETSSAERPT